MTDSPRKFDGPNSFDGEDRQTEELAPENLNSEQDDEAGQAQTLANEAAGRDAGDFATGESDKVSTGDDSDDAQDLVDHMKQMVSSGRIDNDAFRGERNDDDEEDLLGEAGEED